MRLRTSRRRRDCNLTQVDVKIHKFAKAFVRFVFLPCLLPRSHCDIRAQEITTLQDQYSSQSSCRWTSIMDYDTWKTYISVCFCFSSRFKASALWRCGSTSPLYSTQTSCRSLSLTGVSKQPLRGRSVIGRAI